MKLLRRLVLADPLDVVVADPHDDPVLSREWLVTNGIGGYASGTVSGAITRRFHGALIASHPAPLGRVMMLNHLAERVYVDDGAVLPLDAQARVTDPAPTKERAKLIEFFAEVGLPVWRYDLGKGRVLEKRLLMPNAQNTVFVTFTMTAGEGTVHLEVEPWLNFRPHEAALDLPLGPPYAVTETGDRYEIAASPDLPTLRLRVGGPSSSFLVKSRTIKSIAYGIEASRGYDAKGDLYAPGSFRCELRAGERATVTASTEPWDVVDAMSFDDVRRCELGRRSRLVAWSLPQLRVEGAAELVLAADQFIIDPPGRVENRTVTHACGDRARSVIAGYHWFTDWGRDTMISLEGLTLVTGRFDDARNIIGTFSRYVKDGLIPNMFPEGKSAGLYHTADATLWFFHAVDRYLAHTRDRSLLASLLPTFVSIAEHHAGGTRFGIGVDSRDGLLRQGAPDLPLTWMDAKVGDLVVTPRRGKAVELNGLYYNALRLLAGWLTEADGSAAARPYVERADQLRASFNARFWYAEGGYLYDILDGDHGDDHALRPNQLLAISLPNPVLDPSRWAAVVARCEEKLVTPMGLRSLAPGEPDYKPFYFGDLRSRDLAYHQGTVWAWLIGPFVDAWMKVHPGENAKALTFLDGFVTHLNEACVGSISEVFDAEAPYTARGCIAQAWSVAETLRLFAVLNPGRPEDGGRVSGA
jgi:predicted glycogen debranching enzyme